MLRKKAPPKATNELIKTTEAKEGFCKQKQGNPNCKKCSIKKENDALKTVLKGMLNDVSRNKKYTLFFQTAKSLLNTMILLLLKLTKANKRIRELLENLEFSKIDELTGLMTRSAFNNYTGECQLRRSNETSDVGGLTFIIIDIDSFKNINDTYGHDAGDVVLKKIAKVLITTFRADDIKVRFGGDELAILSNLPKKTVEKKITKVLTEVESLMFNKPIKTTVSIGVAQKREKNTTLDKLVKLADIALYHAKHEGKNRFRFYERKMTMPIKNKS